jgi:hypothetical protein
VKWVDRQSSDGDARARATPGFGMTDLRLAVQAPGIIKDGQTCATRLADQLVFLKLAYDRFVQPAFTVLGELLVRRVIEDHFGESPIGGSCISRNGTVFPESACQSSTAQTLAVKSRSSGSQIWSGGGREFSHNVRIT